MCSACIVQLCSCKLVAFQDVSVLEKGAAKKNSKFMKSTGQLTKAGFRCLLSSSTSRPAAEEYSQGLVLDVYV